MASDDSHFSAVSETMAFHLVDDPVAKWCDETCFMMPTVCFWTLPLAASVRSSKPAGQLVFPVLAEDCVTGGGSAEAVPL